MDGRMKDNVDREDEGEKEEIGMKPSARPSYPYLAVVYWNKQRAEPYFTYCFRVPTIYFTHSDVALARTNLHFLAIKVVIIIGSSAHRKTGRVGLSCENGGGRVTSKAVVPLQDRQATEINVSKQAYGTTLYVEFLCL